MYTPWDIMVLGKSRLQRTRRRGRAAGCRRLGIEQLEDRRVLSGLPLLPAPMPVTYGPVQPPVPSTHASAKPLGSATLPIQLSAETTVGQSIDAFAESLYRQLQSQPGGSGNLFLSPLSISTALAMTYAGARGETATQMAAALHYTLDANTLAADFGGLIADLNSAGQGNYALSVADALWGQQGSPFLSSFLNLMQTDYGGGLHQVDFINATEAARQTINNWVAQQTNDKIQNLIPQGALDQLTRLVLTNAVYFKGQWATAFDPSLTQNAAFTLGSGGQVQVPTMHAVNLYGYMQSDGYQVLELPYQGNRLVMDVLLPSATSGLSGLDAGQLPADLSGWLQGMAPQQVDVSLPKFKMTTQFTLNQSLEALGMTDAFNPYGAADFSGISTNPLSISSVIHKAFIDVDETGTEAAGATGVVVATSLEFAPYAPPIVFNADHPFLFLIRDTQSGSVLFMGQVADPTATSGDFSAPAVPKSQPVTGDPITIDPIVPAPINPILPPSPIIIDPLPVRSPSQLPVPTVQLTSSPIGLTNLNNSSLSKAPQFEVSGLVAPPLGDTVQVIVYADGTQIGEATATGSSAVVTANGTTRLTDGTHKITAVESGTSLPATVTSNVETITVGTIVPRITSTPVTQAVPGWTMNYQVMTSAAASEQLSYILVTAPAGMAISSSGKLRWDPAIGTIAPQRVDVRVTDQYGNFADQTFSIRVSGDLTPYDPFAPRNWDLGFVGPIDHRLS